MSDNNTPYTLLLNFINLMDIKAEMKFRDALARLFY